MNAFALQTARKATLSKFFRLVPRAALSALVQEVDEIADMLQHAAIAQEEFRKLSQEETDHIFDAIAHEANRYRVPLAKLAIQETKMGCFEDKIMKNGLACELIHDRYRPLKTCGLIASDPTHGKHTYAFPVGPVCAITPVTNPTSTAIAKSLVMVKTRNAGIVLPHHRASESTFEAVRICHDAGVRAGAPDGWVQCVEHPSRDVKKQVLNSDEIKMILATGGPGIIRACKDAGKPALSGGAGNAPVLVDELADLKTACSFIVLGKTFDNGMTCAAEQSIVVVGRVYDEFKSLLQERGVYFLNSYDRMLLSSYIHKDGHINPDIVGQTPVEIAKRAGIKTKLPRNTVVLGTEESIIGPENPLSGEKLSPVISLFRAKDFTHGVSQCQALALNGGVGHTAGIHTAEEGRLSARVQQFVEHIPVGRVIVNAPIVLTAIGTAFNFNMDPSFTLGVGTQAGSSLSTSLSPTDLISTVTVAERQPHMEWYHLPPNIFFNRGCLEEAIQQCAMPDETGTRCRRAMVVTDMGIRKCGYLARLLKALKKEGFEVNVFDQVQPDPNIELVRAGVEVCKTFKPDIIFCIGGGSAIDAGKFIRVKY
jgi:acetaldehyde dehydrogenase/alcohol dehydrogenase